MNKLSGIALGFVTALSNLAALSQDVKAQDVEAQDRLPQKKTADLSAEIQAGAEYDSTLTVAELDQTSSKDDWAEILNGRVGAEFHPTERINLKASYSFNSRDYREYSSFDQILHIASADASIDLVGATWGISHHFAHAKLDSKPFLDLSKTSVYVGKLFSSGIYLRGAISESDKRFDNNSERNSDGDEIAGEVYYFFNDARSFWSFGVSRETESARSPAFDNRALHWRARYSHTGEIAGLTSQVQLGWRYTDREYRKEASLFEGTIDRTLDKSKRHDRSQVVELSWALNLLEPLTLDSKIEHGNYRSNLDAASYEETGVSVLLSLAF